MPDATGLELTAHDLRERNAESIIGTDFSHGRATLLAQPTPEIYLWSRKSWLWEPPSTELVPDQYAFTTAKNDRAMSFAVRAIVAQPAERRR